MKICLTICFIFLQVVAVRAQLEKVNASNYLAELSVKDGKLNGEYISFYKNGTVKARGEYRNNVRTGKWYVNDSTGKKI